MQEMSEQTHDVEQIMLTLHRVNADWPHLPDLQHYADTHPHLFPYESVEAAVQAIARHHETDANLDRIRGITRAMQYRAINGFTDKYMPGQPDRSKGDVREHIEAFLMEEDFRGLEIFLCDVVNLGHLKAIEEAEKTDRGATVWHVAAGLFALVEVGVLILAIAACQHGFQTITIAALGLLYSNVTFFGFSRNLIAAQQTAGLGYDTVRIRKALRDRPLRWDLSIEARKLVAKDHAKETVRLYIRSGKALVMNSICVVAIIISSL